MNQNTQIIIQMADGKTSSGEIAKKIGLTPRYVRKVMKQKNLPQLPSGPPRGESNPAWKGGRCIDHDGYANIPAPKNHPYARQTGRIPEHRFVMEQTLGRYLQPQEVVDHIDGLTLHNDPQNLRVFESNATHLKATSTGKRNWTKDGHQNIGKRSDLGTTYQPVDSYRQRKKSGDVRLRQVLLAWLSLDKDSPHLSGTRHLLEKAGIDPDQDSSLKHALDSLSRKWEQGQTLL